VDVLYGRPLKHYRSIINKLDNDCHVVYS